MNDGPGRDPDDASRSSIDRTVESRSLPRSLSCPFCRSSDTEQFSPFGGQVSTAQYYCNACRTVFEAMRWR